MTTIIRVKRRRGEDPIEALVLSCKRKKTTVEESSQNEDSNMFKYILNFSGTVEDKDNKIAATTVETFRKDFNHSELKNKEHVPDIKAKQRNEWKERNEKNRFMLLSCLRSSNSFETDHSIGANDSQKQITIVDVKKENEENFCALNAVEDSFVYDLYSTNIESDSDYNDMFMEHLLSVQPLETEFNYQNEGNYSDEIDQDEDDSNDENNWRNEYPDSDIYEEEEEDNDDENNDESDILSRQFNKFHIDNNVYESSSESENEKYLNYEDDEKYCYYAAEDLAGRRYARYKANAMRMMIANDEDQDRNEKKEEEGLDSEDSFLEKSD